MINQLKIFQSDSYDPYYNLAVEKHLFDIVEKGCVILYLWQNDNTIVIGANQNPWAECNHELAKSENETDLSILDQTRGLLLNHVNKVISLLGSEGETDLSFSFILLDDTKVLAHKYAAGAVIATVTVIRGEPISIESVFSSWNGTSDEAVISEDAALPTEMKETITKKEPTFILNTNSRKFHIPTCDSVGKMKEENRKEYFGQRDDLVSTGYSPCGSCHP